ncbi:MAG TPA: ABC transporter ATP-binding protein, partial [Thermodesulfobacteriota bacterium]
LDPKTAHVIYAHLRDLVTREGRTVLMVDQNVLAGTEAADYIYVLELGRNRIACDRAEFEARYRATIAEWLI